MLWFAGLMSLVGFGAASAIDTDTTKEDGEDDHTSANAASNDVEQNQGTDLFETIATMDFESNSGMGTNGDTTAGISGADAADQLILDAVMSDASATAISDFTPEKDSLLFVWDDTYEEDEPLNITVQSDPEHDGEVQVWFGDQVIAQVSGPSALLDVDIALMPFSSAQALELVET